MRVDVVLPRPGVRGVDGWSMGGHTGREMSVYGAEATVVLRCRLDSPVWPRRDRVDVLGREIMTVYASLHVDRSSGISAICLSASSIQFDLSKKRCCGASAHELCNPRDEQSRFDCLARDDSPVLLFRDIDGHEYSERQIGERRRCSSSSMDIIPFNHDWMSSNLVLCRVWSANDRYQHSHHWQTYIERLLVAVENEGSVQGRVHGAQAILCGGQSALYVIIV